ncbi:hypothetical protein OROMI_027297 [Orobanche minor]
MAGEILKEEEKNEVGSVKILSTTNVKPSKPIGRKECQLVTFDLPYLAFYYNQKLLIYKGGLGALEEIVKKLKDGLALVLEEFYQLAGKLEKDQDDGTFKVVYEDDMEGVEVVAAAAEEVEVAELTAEEGTSKFKELLPYNGVLNLEGMQRPLVAVQLTKLKDGLAMGCAFNHAILDGTSTWHFMSSWAQICSGSTSISTPPFLDRTKARNTRVKLNLSQPSDAPEHAKSAANGDAAAKSDPQLREKVFKFSESAVDQIKSKVNAATPGSKPFSTFQSLSAHVWQAVTRARELAPGDHTVFTVFADCRSRVSPPMPESYFGNLIQAIFTVTAAGLILSSPVEFGAGLIRTAIESHNAEAINKRNEEWESNPIIFQYKDAGVNCVAVGSSPRFKVYEVDFGWGSPESVRSGLNNRFDGMVYLYPGKSGGRSIDVEISLEAKAMERLEKDKEFLLEV